MPTFKVDWSHLLCSLLGSFVLAGCGDRPQHKMYPARAATCAPAKVSANQKADGLAQVFFFDPILSGAPTQVTPDEPSLERFARTVPLRHLLGTSLLSGKYVDVVNGLDCQGDFGAYSKENRFVYPHGDPRFQEAMAYYYGDFFQALMDAWGHLGLAPRVKIIAHCSSYDNAYFTRIPLQLGGVMTAVCLGRSSLFDAAHYADDAGVLVHELQHGITGLQYSSVHDLHQLWYDEGGVLDEAISDFVALVIQAGSMKTAGEFDRKLFGRWALGKLDPEHSSLRGAHRCSMLDQDFPECRAFPNFQVPLRAGETETHLSFVYPDGLGWPFAKNETGSNPLAQVFQNHLSQEEIHNNASLMTGALFELYEILEKGNRTEVEAQRLAFDVVFEALRHLPVPNATLGKARVTLIEYSQRLLKAAKNLELPKEEQEGLRWMLTERGLLKTDGILDPDWLAVGSGGSFLLPSPETPGAYVLTRPALLNHWLKQIRAGSSYQQERFLPESQWHQLVPGFLSTVWFDLENKSETTAGHVQLFIQSETPWVECLPDRINRGMLIGHKNPVVQIVYSKINGRAIVAQLKGEDPGFGLMTGPTYFKTNPNFFRGPTTGLWVKVHPETPPGTEAIFHIRAVPSNGVSSETRIRIPIRSPAS
jgi:hypothetical protein